MAVTIKKKAKAKAKSKTKALPGIAKLKKLVNPLHEAEEVVTAAKEKLAKATALQGKVIDEIDEIIENWKPAFKTEVIDEWGHVLVIGAEGTSREITDKEAVIEMLEDVQEGLAFELANFTLGDLDKYLTPVQQSKTIAKNYSGRRTIKTK